MDRDTFDPLNLSLPALPPGGRYLVAFSGGLDSSVLLHALVNTHADKPLAAIHIHHGLQSAADAWPEHCQAICKRLGVSLKTVNVRPHLGPGLSLEAEARKARYEALRDAMRPGDVLITAHHLDDQAETLLLQLLRGAGPRGLAAMASVSPFPPGQLARPLLATQRHQLEAYASRHGLTWVDDPSNRDTGHSRNYLRQAVMPLLRARWPEMATTLGRSAQLCAEAAELLEEQANQDLVHCEGIHPGSLHIPALMDLPVSRRRNLLRAWIGRLDLPLPEARHLLRVDNELLGAARDATPVLSWPGVELRRYRDAIYAMRPLAPSCTAWQVAWTPPSPLVLPTGGTLQAEAVTAATKPSLRLPRDGETVEVRLAMTGEALVLARRSHHARLKKLCQEAGIPPWLRRRLPVVMYNGRVAAVASHWVCKGFDASVAQPAWQLRWQDAPPGYPGKANY